MCLDVLCQLWDVKFSFDPEIPQNVLWNSSARYGALEHIPNLRVRK